jgi:serine/threonine protein kinase
MPDDRKEQKLDEILASYLKAAQVGQAPSQQALLDQHPDLRPELAEFFRNQDVFARMTAPLRHIVTDDGTRPGQCMGDYELLEKIAQGGMGVVWRALQKSLHRVVAVKMLRAGARAGHADRRRFRSEAEAVARLDHPGIVPIYEVGEQDDELYFSMKLLEGGNLSQHRSRYAGDPRATARLLADVAAAVYYAHQRGILHRDLKPANILLDENGRPHVSDFGLAKRIPGNAGSVDPARLTQSGAILGTPSYMAPEQATGRPEAVTTAADVYSLGAILYELLTGRPPFREATLLETLLVVLENEPPRPRTLNARADRDLETICLKCLDKDTGRRYASARDLADDLERFLADEPIHARPLPRLWRVWRWCRRQPVLAGLSAALSTSFVIGFLLVTSEWRRADANARKATDNLAEVDRQRSRAKDNFRLAHKAVNDLLRRITEIERQNFTALPGRKELLEDALQYYQTFLREAGADPEIQRDLADAHVHLGHINDAIGSRSAALASYQQALSLYQELQQARPKDADLRARLAGTWYDIGTAQYAVGQPATARTSLNGARTLYEAFLKDSPDDPRLLAGLGQALSSLGAQERERHRPAEGLALFEEAKRRQEKLARLQPKDAVTRNTLAGIHADIGGALADLGGRDNDALAAYQKARGHREDLVQEWPRVLQFQRDLAEVHHQIGAIQQRLRKFADARLSNQQAHFTFEKLAQEHPGVHQFQHDLASSLVRVGSDHVRDGRLTDALACYHQARSILEKLIKADPGVHAYRYQLSVTWTKIGQSHVDPVDRAEAMLAFQTSRALAEKLVAEDPQNSRYRCDLGTTLNNLAMRKDLDGGLRVARQGVETMRVGFDQAPHVENHRFILYNTYGTFGEILRVSGRCAEAAATIEERYKLYPDNPRELYRVARDWGLLANRISFERKELLETEREEQKKYADRALETLQRAVGRGFQDATVLDNEVGFALLRSHREFQKLAEEVRTRAKTKP